jgi:hypothetical protein
MALMLRIGSGAKFGLRYRIREGIRIGRSSGDIKISDSKMSSLHAQIVLNPLGGFALQDNNSTHGIIVGEHRLRELTLELGVQFKLGRTLFEVIEAEAAPEEEVEIVVETEPSWESLLIKSLSILPTRNKANSNIVSLKKLVHLSFVEGLEYEREVTLGYGPRKFGANPFGVELFEPGCPDEAFTIFCSDASIFFKTSHPQVVLLNNSSQESAVLKPGDEIRIGQTLMKVRIESISY